MEATAQDCPDDEILELCMNDLIDDIVCGLCFEIHRSCKIGTFMLDDSDLSNHNRFDIIDEVGLDVFGQPPIKKQFECICPSCQQSLAASRFAPHLEKCMGMGRMSSRIASRRIATSSSGCRRGSDVESDDDDDNDASYVPDRSRAKRARRDKTNGNGSKRNRTKQRNTDSPSTGSDISSSQASNYDNSTIDDRKHLSVYTCSVLPENSKRPGVRSTKQQRTENQRRNMRLLLLDSHGTPSSLAASHLSVASDDINVDVDSDVQLVASSSSMSDLLSLQWAGPDNDDHNSNASISAESSTSSITTLGGSRRHKFST